MAGSTRTSRRSTILSGKSAAEAVAYREKSLFILTMHPHVIGHRSRMVELGKFVTYLKSKPGVWFATGEQIARYLKEQNPKT